MPLDHSAGEHPYFAQDEGRPLVMAHRGGGGLWPENTLYAFERAAEMGVDVIETEIHSTADNKLVFIHDETVDRTTNGTGTVNSLTLKELKEFDAGYNWTADGGRTFPFRGKGITVPTLEEVFTALPNIRINIDMKQINPSLAAPLCEMINSFDMAKKVMVASFNTRAINDFRRACSGVATSASRREVTLFFLMNLVRLTDQPVMPSRYPSTAADCMFSPKDFCKQPAVLNSRFMFGPLTRQRIWDDCSNWAWMALSQITLTS